MFRRKSARRRKSEYGWKIFSKETPSFKKRRKEITKWREGNAKFTGNANTFRIFHDPKPTFPEYLLFMCRWDDDVVFKNCAKGEEERLKGKGYINDTLRSEFHKKFMDKYVKWSRVPVTKSSRTVTVQLRLVYILAFELCVKIRRTLKRDFVSSF